MKRKKSNVKKIVIIGLILAILLLTILSPFIFINIKLIGDKRIELDYGEKYSEPGFKAYMFNKEITDKIKINNNIKEDIGNYKVTYSYQFFIYKIKRTRKKISPLADH